MAINSKKKSSNKQISYVRVAVVSMAVFLVLLMGNIDTANNKIFGYQVNGDYGMPLINHIVTLSGITLLVLFLNRKTITWQFLKKLSLTILAIFLFLFGWTLASTEWGQSTMHNDGYSVTGAFMMFFSGLYFGYVLSQKMDNGRK